MYCVDGSNVNASCKSSSLSPQPMTTIYLSGFIRPNPKGCRSQSVFRMLGVDGATRWRPFITKCFVRHYGHNDFAFSYLVEDVGEMSAIEIVWAQGMFHKGIGTLTIVHGSRTYDVPTASSTMGSFTRGIRLQLPMAYTGPAIMTAASVEETVVAVGNGTSVTIPGKVFPEGSTIVTSTVPSSDDEANAALSSTIVSIIVFLQDGAPFKAAHLVAPVLLDVINRNQECYKEAKCTWWDHLSNAWLSDGCETVSSSGDDSSIQCRCSHLTEFALSLAERQNIFPIRSMATVRGVSFLLYLPVFVYCIYAVSIMVRGDVLRSVTIAHLLLLTLSVLRVVAGVASGVFPGVQTGLLTKAVLEIASLAVEFGVLAFLVTAYAVLAEFTMEQEKGYAKLKPLVIGLWLVAVVGVTLLLLLPSLLAAEDRVFLACALAGAGVVCGCKILLAVLFCVYSRRVNRSRTKPGSTRRTREGCCDKAKLASASLALTAVTRSGLEIYVLVVQLAPCPDASAWAIGLALGSVCDVITCFTVLLIYRAALLRARPKRSGLVCTGNSVQ